MKLSIDFAELQSIINESSIILTDKSVDDKRKNIIFLVTPDSTKLVFYNPFTFARVEAESAVSDGIEEGENWVFQVRLSEVQKIMSSYNNLNRTHVETLDFIDAKSKVRMVLHEVANDEEYEFLSRDSVNNLDSIPVISSIITEVSNEVPEDMEDVEVSLLSTYLEGIIPLLTNEGKGVSSRINFSDKYIFLISNVMSIFYKNALPDSFKNLALGYSSCVYLKKLCDTIEGEAMSMKCLDKVVCVSTGKSDTFMRWQPIKIKYDMYINNLKTDNCIQLDRLYLKDVLRRLVIETDGTFSINKADSTVVIETPAFTQEIPIEKMKGELEGIKFKINSQTFTKMIAGSDATYPDKVTLCFVANATGNGYSVYMMDDTSAWMTFMVVR